MTKKKRIATVNADRPLTIKQTQIVDHIMTTGDSVKKTSEALNSDIRNIYRTLSLPHVKKELQARTLEHIGILAPYAARTQQQLLHAESDHVRATVAENILDRHLGKPVMRQQIALQGQIHAVIDLS